MCLPQPGGQAAVLELEEVRVAEVDGLAPAVVHRPANLDARAEQVCLLLGELGFVKHISRWVIWYGEEH